MPENVFSVRKAAEMLGIGRSTLYELVEQRSISHHRFGSRIIFTQDDIDEFLQECAVKKQRKTLDYVPKRAI